MSNVDLTIGGRTFTVACAVGEENHVAGLGRMIDSKLSAMGGLSNQSESRALLFAALLLADELHEARSSSAAASSAPAPVTPLGGDPELLEAIALRLENIASRLEAERD
jgi:cell division protein ZapA